MIIFVQYLFFKSFKLFIFYIKIQYRTVLYTIQNILQFLNASRKSWPYHVTINCSLIGSYGHVIVVLFVIGYFSSSLLLFPAINIPWSSSEHGAALLAAKMPKRTCPFPETFSSQYKIHLGQRELNKYGVFGNKNRQEIYGECAAVVHVVVAASVSFVVMLSLLVHLALVAVVEHKVILQLWKTCFPLSLYFLNRLQK